MKLNRKGFTLIELLSIIVIISLVSGITITVALGAINNAKTKSQELTISNVANQAEKYIYEGLSSRPWSQDTENTEYQCVTVRELIEAGYFKKNIIVDNKDILDESYTVKITRDKLTKTVLSRKLEDNHTTNECTQQIITGSSITCEVPSGWASEKDVEIIFNTNSIEGGIHPINGIYLNKISYTEVDSLSNPTFSNPNEKYYTTTNDSITVKAISNGFIYANSINNNEQIGSLVCVVNGIDHEGPNVELNNIDDNVIWINRNKEIKLIMFIEDDNAVDKTARIPVNNINVLVSGVSVTPATKQINLISDDSPKNEAYYELTLSGITGNGDLSIKVLNNTFKDQAQNGNEEIELTTNIKVDNIKPKLDSVIDSESQSWYDKNNDKLLWNTDIWHNDKNYTVTSNVKDDDGAPIIGGYLGNNSTNIDETLLESFPIISNYNDNGKYIFIMDAAGNFNKYGPYKILIDTQRPNVDLSVSNGNNLSCTITDGESKVVAYKICKEGTCNSTSYTTISPVSTKTITKNGVANGKWYCYGKDAVNNESSDDIEVQNSPSSGDVTLNATFKVYYENGNLYDDKWTNNSLTLKGVITHNSSEVYYKIDTNSGNLTTGGTKLTTNTTVTSTATSSGTYYLRIRYKDANGNNAYRNKSLTVKIDKTKPTCQISITENNSANGITINKKCSDTGGSGCTTSSTTYSNVTESKTYSVYDNAGNKGTCPTVTVTMKGRRKYCAKYSYDCKFYEDTFMDHVSCSISSAHTVWSPPTQSTPWVKSYKNVSYYTCSHYVNQIMNEFAHCMPSTASLVYNSANITPYLKKRNLTCNSWNTNTSSDSCTSSHTTGEGPYYSCKKVYYGKVS